MTHEGVGLRKRPLLPKETQAASSLRPAAGSSPPRERSQQETLRVGEVVSSRAMAEDGSEMFLGGGPLVRSAKGEGALGGQGAQPQMKNTGASKRSALSQSDLPLPSSRGLFSPDGSRNPQAPTVGPTAWFASWLHQATYFIVGRPFLHCADW